MAEVLLGRKVSAKGIHGVRVSSAGTIAAGGSPPSSEAFETMKEEGIDIRNFESSALTEVIVGRADIILVMGESHKHVVDSIIPGFAKKTFLLGEFDPEGGALEIADPVGCPLETFRQCAQQISRCLDGFVKKLPELRERLSPETVDFAVGTDHRGVALKALVLKSLDELGLSWEDVGAFDPKSCDYPSYAIEVAERVSSGVAKRGALVCGTGAGMSIAANKVKGVRAAVVSDKRLAELTRSHNNANVIVFSEDVPPEELRELLQIWWETEFEGGRHARRIGLITEYEEKHIRGTDE